MSLEAWIAFCVTEAVLCFTPGPAVLLVVSAALGRGLRASLGASLGILTANTLYFALSATGVAAAVVASRELFLVLKWSGAAYLVWLGLRMAFSRAPREANAQPVPVSRSFVWEPIRGSYSRAGANLRRTCSLVKEAMLTNLSRELRPRIILTRNLAMPRVSDSSAMTA